jgi:hypothetical protein
MTLLKDLIDIPEYVDRGAFVLKLSEGVTDPDATLKSYVVTEQLVKCFDDALNFVKAAVTGRTSKATYLHGSFGSGKSHFMAVLNLILQGNTNARSIPELATVIAKHNVWTHGKTFLLVPYHMIGARDLESGVLGGYADYVRRMHPDAPVPGIYRAEGLFADAAKLREAMEDHAFFMRLNEGENRGGGWGELSAAWDAASYDTALNAAPGSEARQRLVGALVRVFFSNYHLNTEHGEAYLPLDQGLSIISQHAKALGYDAVILFLDELILWLASHAQNLSFIQHECGKVAKLVEAQHADRPVPIVSFVARQRDLRELIGDSVPGAERLNFSDALGWQQGRFHTITLEDRNLPAIAEKRVLRPQSDAARSELDAAFEQSVKIREQVMNTLLTSEGDKAMFRKVYPFSPALVQTLVAVSSVLQRERTALKVMLQLLVQQRDTLKVGDIVPVGDLFDVVAHGDEAFSQEMALHFDNAKRLYHQKLLPQLEAQHGRVEELDTLPLDDPRRTAFHNDDRLVKTLLLSALVPQVESLRALTPDKLAALNHGTIKSPIAGREGAEVLRRCKIWAASVGELRYGDEHNPVITLQLSGVDTETIIEQARKEDNQGNRIRLMRTMLFEALGIEDRGELLLEHEFLWKNTRRKCEVLFRNIRELPSSSLENTGVDWRLVIDWPFDEQGFGPRDDLAKLSDFRSHFASGAKTLCWMPAFFSKDAMRDLGMLVILQHVLAGERFGQYANHLSPQDRQSAKSLLENQRSVLTSRVKNHLEAAYGLSPVEKGSLDTTHDLETHERFISLTPGFDLQPPAGGTLGAAMAHLLSQALKYDYPAAPEFEAEAKSANIRKVFEDVQRAARATDGRVLVEQSRRALLRQIANPLRLGEMGYDATHFVLGQHWKNHFTKKAAESGGEVTVTKLRGWMDEPKAMGLPKEAQNLLILTYAEQTNRSFFIHSGPCEVSLTDIPDLCELREQRLPSEESWNAALRRAGALFGLAPSPLLNAVNLQALVKGVKEKTAASLTHCRTYQEELRTRLRALDVSMEHAERAKTAEATVALLSQLQDGQDDAIVGLLASAQMITSEQAMGECLAKAASLRDGLRATNWDLLDAVGKLDDARKSQGAEILDLVRDAVAHDEHVQAIAPRLLELQSRATRLLTQQIAPPPPPSILDEPLPPHVHEPVPKKGRRVVRREQKENLTMSDTTVLLAELSNSLAPNEQIRLNVAWVIEAEEDQT